MPSACRLDDFFRDRLRRLEASGAPEPRLNLGHLLARRLGLPRLELALHGADILSETDRSAVDAEIERLMAGEPLQYILGDVPFHGLAIRTDRRALIPRPETEWLVEQILACDSVWSDASPRLVDVGTGTGCIALALSAAKPQARLLAVDRDPGALELARENRDRLGLAGRVELHQGDLLTGLPDGAFDAVVSNPPYIPSAVCTTLDRPVRDHEPRQALDGGPDGLAVIRRLVPQARLCLKPGGSIWLEIGFDQGAAVKAILGDTGFERAQIRRDIAGLDRLACGWRPDSVPPRKSGY